MNYVIVSQGQDKNIGVENDSDLYMERMAYSPKPLTFSNVLTDHVAGAESGDVSCSGLEYVLVMAYFANDSDTANIRLGFTDSNNELIYTPVYTLNNSGIADGSNYIGYAVSVLALGFDKVRLRIDADIANDTTFYIGV